MRTKWAVFLIFCAYVMALAALTAPARAETEAVSLPALMYHHISADAAARGDYVITPAELEADLRWLDENGYEAVSVRALADWRRGEGELPERPVLITFDDAQLSFMLYALPLLEKYDMRAVLAVVGDYADEYTASGDRNPAYAYMSWADVAGAAASGRVEIASHTQSMHASSGARRGCRINPGEDEAAYSAALNADLERVEASIERAAGERPYIFAYPFGFTCEEAARVLTSRGYAAALTCDGRVNTLTRAPDAQTMTISRINRPASAPASELIG